MRPVAGVWGYVDGISETRVGIMPVVLALDG
jgi:hypothetical protein